MKVGSPPFKVYSPCNGEFWSTFGIQFQYMGNNYIYICLYIYNYIYVCVFYVNCYPVRIPTSHVGIQCKSRKHPVVRRELRSYMMWVSIFPISNGSQLELLRLSRPSSLVSRDHHQWHANQAIKSIMLYKPVTSHWYLQFKWFHPQVLQVQQLSTCPKFSMASKVPEYRIRSS